MAGQAAGTLEIQLVTDVVRLQQDMRAAQRAIDTMTSSGERGAQRMGAAYTKGGQQVMASAGAQRAGMQQLGMQINDIATMYALGAKPAQIFASQIGQITQAVQLAAGGSSKFAAFLGGPWGVALTAAVVVLSPFVAKLFESEKALKAAEFASYGMKDAQGVLAGVMDMTTGKITTQSKALHALAQAQALAMEVQARSRRAEAGRTIQAARDGRLVGGSMMGLAPVGRQRSPAAGVVTRFQSGDLSPRDTLSRLDELREAGKLTEQQFLDLGAAVANYGVEAENIKVAEQLAKALNGDTAAIQGFLKEDKKRTSAAERRAETLARESAATEALIAGLYRAAEAYAVSTAAGQRARIEAEALEKGMRKQADVQDYVAQQQRKNVASLVVSSAEETAGLLEQVKAQEFVNKAVAAGTISVEDATEALANMMEQRRLMTAMQIAGANGDIKGYDAAKKALSQLTEAQLRDIAARKESADQAKKAQLDRQIDSVRLETRLTKELGEARIVALRGSSGAALEDQLADIAAAHEKAGIQARAEAEAAELVKLGYDDAAAAVLRKAEADKTQVDVVKDLEAQERALQRIAERVNALTSAMGNGQLGKFLGALTSNNPTAGLLGIGGVGTLLGLGTKGGQEAYSKQRQAIEDGLTAVLGPKAQGFAKTMSELLQGAGTGSIVGGLLGGGQNAQMGSMMGGALGQKFGEKFLGSALTSISKGLGDFAGPLGSIIGSLAGNLLGSLMSSTPRGSATFDETGLKGYRGTSDARIAGSKKAGSSVLDAFDSLLEELGATATGVKFSTGIRKKSFTLDPIGGGRTKGAGVLNFGSDEEAFLAATLKEIISDASFTGLSEGFQRMLKSGEIEEQIAKALSLKGAINDLSALKDPQGTALAALDKEFAKLRDIATEAGEGLAQIEELYGLKRKDIVDKYAQEAIEQENKLASMRVTLLELQGKSADALALSRKIELSTMTEAEKVIQRQIHAEQDLARARVEAAQAASDAAAAEEKALAAFSKRYNEQSDLIEQLLEMAGETEALRVRELQKLDPANRALQQLIWTREDEAAAAAEAATKLKAVSDERYGLETQWLQAIGNEAELRKRALALLDPSNRAMQQQIWVYEDAQKAAQAEIDARNQQIASIRSTIDALSGAQAKWMEFAANIREFRAGLFSPDKGSGLSVQQARADFDRTAKMAAFGDEKALQSFTGVSQTFLDAARSSARSQLDYQRAIGLVAGAADAAAKGADGVGAQAANEYAALQAQITQLEALNEQPTATVAALAGVGDVQENEVVPTLENVVDQLKANGKDAMAIAKDRQAAEVSTVSRLEAVETLLARLLQHLQEETTAVTTSNTPATPIYVDQVP